VSLTGVLNTFQNLLPIEAARKSYFTQTIKELKTGYGSISVFVGLNASHEELVATLKNFFPSSLMARPNKLEGLSLETLSSQVLEFEGKAKDNPIVVPFRCFLLG
jgi:hypothetical protein